MGAADGPTVVEGITYIPLSGRTAESGLNHGRGASAPLRHFVAGPENRLVEVAVRLVLDELDEDCGPIFLYGPSGTGKSHLAHGLIAAWKSRHRRRGAVYLTATDFARQLADAVEAQGVADFRHDLLRASLVVIEDVGRLRGKQAAQWELTTLLDEWIAAGTRVVFTAAEAPGEVAGLSARLQSRLTAGLTVPLVPPGREARLALLQQWAALRGMSISDPVVELLASQLPGTAPELFGALVQLETTAADRPEGIDREVVHQYIQERKRARSVTIRDIAAATARRFALRTRDLQSASRRRQVVRARGVAMYLARELNCGSLQQVGTFFGGRDHTTVLHGCRRTEELMETEPAIRRVIDEVRRQIGAA